MCFTLNWAMSMASLETPKELEGATMKEGHKWEKIFQREREYPKQSRERMRV